MKSTAQVSERRDRKPNRRGEGARLREEIVAAAGELVDETGTASAVTLSAVARRVGIAAPSIYSHFASPDAILLTVVAQELRGLRERLNAATEPAASGPTARLHTLCTAYLDAARDRPQRYLLMFGGIWDRAKALQDAPEDQAELAELGMAPLWDLVAAVQACIDAGESAGTDAHSVAVALWVALHGLAHQRIVSGEMTWPDGLEERIVAGLAGLGG